MSGYATFSIRSSYWNGSRLASWGSCLEIVFTNHAWTKAGPPTVLCRYLSLPPISTHVRASFCVNL